MEQEKNGQELLSPMLNRLTPAEKTVLRRVAEYKTSREIARELGISHRTVQNHRAHICKRLGLTGPNALFQFVALHLRPGPAGMSTGTHANE